MHHDWLQNVGAQNSQSCHPNRPGHPERLDCDGWWMLVVCCCGCRQAGHLVLLLAIVKRGYWRLTLPLWLRSMRFDDVVMDTKWLFKEVKWEHPAMFLHIVKSILNPNKLNGNRPFWFVILGIKTKGVQFIAKVCSGYSYNKTSQNHHCRDNLSTSKHVFFETRRLFVASPM